MFALSTSIPVLGCLPPQRLVILVTFNPSFSKQMLVKPKVSTSSSLCSTASVLKKRNDFCPHLLSVLEMLDVLLLSQRT